MALPPHNLALHLQLPHQHHQQQPQRQQQQQSQPQPFPFGTTFTSADGAHLTTPFLPTSSLADPPPPPPASFVHVMGVSPVGGGGDVGSDGWEQPAKKRAREQELLETSQISSVDFLQTGSVSTGLGLSLDDRRLAGSSSADSPPPFSLFGDEIGREIRRQEAEMDRFLKVQGERLRQAILEKVQAKQLQSLASVEEIVVRKLRNREAEIESMNRKNLELEEQMKQLSVEVDAWQNHARYNESMIAALRFNLQQVLAQSRDSKEGCGDSEVDDTASCCNRDAVGLPRPAPKEAKGKEPITCKVCRVNEVCMLLLPCRHLCLCKHCENKLGECPVCQSSKLVGIEIYM